MSDRSEIRELTRQLKSATERYRVVDPTREQLRTWRSAVEDARSGLDVTTLVRASLADQQARQKSLEETFHALLGEWRAATKFESSMEKIVAHPAYQQVIGLGRPAIPLLLNELRAAPAHLFWALHCITRVNPVQVDAEGNLVKMACAWLEWGRAEGFID